LPTFALGDPIVPPYTVATYATIGGPVALTFDPSGVLYCGRDETNPPGTGSYQIGKVGVGGSPVAYFGPVLRDPDAVLFDSLGAVSGTPRSVIVGTGSGIVAVRPDATSKTLLSGYHVNGLVFDGSGRLVWIENANNSVYVMTGGVRTLLFTELTVPAAIAASAAGLIYTSSSAGTIRVHDSSGNLVNDNFVTGLGGYALLAVGHGDVWGTDLYASCSADGRLLRIDNNGTATQCGTGFAGDWIGFGPDDRLYIADNSNNRIFVTVPEPAICYIAASGLVALGLLRFPRRRHRQ
jgi:hypothetical protein